MAIAFDNKANGNGASGNSLTFSHTCAGTNGLLLVWAFSAGNDYITGATYSAVSMTQLAKIRRGLSVGFSGFFYLFGLLGPATGANNIVVSSSQNSIGQCASQSYTGVSQVNLPDAIQANAGNIGSAPASLTSVGNNIWYAAAWDFKSGVTSSSGTDPWTERYSLQAGPNFKSGDSGQSVAGGGVSYSHTYSAISPADDWSNIIVSFAPVSAGGGGFFMNFL